MYQVLLVLRLLLRSYRFAWLDLGAGEFSVRDVCTVHTVDLGETTGCREGEIVDNDSIQEMTATTIIQQTNKQNKGE